MLAREIATLDVLSNGRVEVGLGAGHMKSEHDDARLPWRAFGERVQVVEDTLLELRRRLSDSDYEPRPVQQPVPIMVGAMSELGLSLAARHADIVGFAGLKQAPGAPAGTFMLSSSEETAQRVGLVRERAGGRAYRSDVLLQAIALGREPADSAAEIAASLPAVTPEQLLDSPFVLLARDAHQAADELRRRSERYGFDSFITHQPHLEALGDVIAAYRIGDVEASATSAHGPQ